MRRKRWAAGPTMRGPRKLGVASATGHCTTQLVQAMQASGFRRTAVISYPLHQPAGGPCRGDGDAETAFLQTEIIAAQCAAGKTDILQQGRASTIHRLQ